ncbi:ech hydrogenase subunit E [Syntrophobotulus glycolicus DSM 8271]|uniref:Ech hydrogenase subunit E n=1 Tax=Syntrophobotulus glycolicus (strain DSM 8271 / FlGlyR) TaxID=645991 RepID=F0T205_SYNGF|nr:nickel-dependent hydrogenase large subunit [Syntrophobotulus glycolicus]ADY56349.1 ech hydrogenase subunit E [Syntrophobotulus glycolicus DSM 8271]
MGERTIIPFGPQHPVLPEPLHLDLILEDEKVVGAVPSIGFVHRGLEKLVEKRDFNEMAYVIERVCGICSFMHGQGYVQTVEGIMGVEIPDRAKYLRTIWAELSRIHSHLLWLGLMADAFGFESLFMHCWRVREKVLDIFEETTGGRVIFSVCKVGGVWKDIDNDTLKRIVNVLKVVETETKELTKVFVKDFTVQKRTKGVGVLTYKEAFELGAAGPVARGSGIAMDLRKLGYAAYSDLSFEPIVEKDGDCYARCNVRIGELFQAIDLIRQAVERIPDGEIEVKVKGNPPKGEYMSRLEQPRGQVVYYARGNGTKFLDRVRVRTPTFANIPPLLKMIPGSDLADIPILALTIDPCISCTER